MLSELGLYTRKWTRLGLISGAPVLYDPFATWAVLGRTPTDANNENQNRERLGAGHPNAISG